MVVLKIFLQKIFFFCQAFRFQIFFSERQLFHNFFMYVFVINGASYAGIYFFVTGTYLLKTERIVFLKLFTSFLPNLQVLYSSEDYHYQNFYNCGKL